MQKLDGFNVIVSTHRFTLLSIIAQKAFWDSTRVAVQDCLEMRCVGSSTDGLPPGVEAIPGPRTQRQVHRLPFFTNLSTIETLEMFCYSFVPKSVFRCSWISLTAGNLHGKLGRRRLCLLLHRQDTEVLVCCPTWHCMTPSQLFGCIKRDDSNYALQGSQICEAVLQRSLYSSHTHNQAFRIVVLYWKSNWFLT